MRSLTSAEVRDIDRRAIEQYGLPGVVLMENAGRNAAALLESQGLAGPVAIVCGKGNNAGDGFVIARHLENRGCDIRVLLACDPQQLTGDAAVNYRVIAWAGTPMRHMATASRPEWLQALNAADWIVDSLLGTGTTGEVREPFATAIAAINDSGRKVFAVDLPSGLDCDTGRPLGSCVRATLTGTFVARKIGFDTPESATWTGPVHVLDIGAPRALLDELDRAR
ncbi:MAG: NAD(P)H-hydrate epimerase [Planctomycetaceae bacterium]|nr:NAD(P)H-hydrate epimerase [Planctomycetaceae bacterium]